jgi:alpha-ketoglutarate-dependent taurine dioxygenase
MIKWPNIEGQSGLPYIVSSRDVSTWGMPCIAPTEWIRENSDFIGEKLLKHGAILFRGFPLNGVEDFDQFADVFCPLRLDYIGGNSPRTKMKNGVYTATEYPGDVKISLHNEASYLKNMPRKLLFYCEAAPTDRGQTPLADCRSVLQSIAPEVRKRFADKGVKYVNNLHGGCGLGRSWQDVFQTKDTRQIEQWLEKMGYEYSWKADGGLRTSIVGSAVAKHPETREDVWVNQAEQWHPSSLEARTRKALLSVFREEDLPHNAYFGDGSPLIEADLEHIRQVLAAHETVFEWKEKDVLLCDNYLVAHGRQPFTGERRILVAIGSQKPDKY